jgi:hypothetical protein
MLRSPGRQDTSEETPIAVRRYHASMSVSAAAVAWLAAYIATVLLAGPARAQDHVPGEVLVRWKPGLAKACRPTPCRRSGLRAWRSTI